MKGSVKWFSNKKGYGFVTAEGSGKDVFIHHSGIRGEGFKTLEEGDQVEFEVAQGPKGELAVNLVKVAGAPKQPVSAENKAA